MAKKKMTKKKITKKKIKKSLKKRKSPKKARATKTKAKKIAKKARKPVKEKVVKLTKKAVEIEAKVGRLLEKGKTKGFVTYDEILKEFPTIEQDILFLESFYERLHTAGVDILEGGGLLDFAHEEAYLPYGVIGIKVWIFRGNVYQDKRASVRMPEAAPARG